MDIDPIDAWQEQERTRHVNACIDALQPLFEDVMRGHAGIDDSLRDARELVERCCVFRSKRPANPIQIGQAFWFNSATASGPFRPGGGGVGGVAWDQ